MVLAIPNRKRPPVFVGIDRNSRQAKGLHFYVPPIRYLRDVVKRVRAERGSTSYETSPVTIPAAGVWGMDGGAAANTEWIWSPGNTSYAIPGPTWCVVTCWVYFDGAAPSTATGTVICCMNDGSTATRNLQVRIANKAVQWVNRNAANSAWNISTAATQTITAEKTLYFIAARIYFGSANDPDCWVNHAKQSMSGASQTTVYSSGNMSIGIGNLCGVTEGLSGIRVFDPRIYTIYKTDEEIFDIRDNPFDLWLDPVRSLYTEQVAAAGNALPMAINQYRRLRS